MSSTASTQPTGSPRREVHLVDRDRRPDPRRRHRVAAAKVRAHVRQPRVGRPGHRRRPPADGAARTRTRTCSGLSRRGRQLRHRHLFEYRLHSVGEVVAGPILHPFSARARCSTSTRVLRRCPRRPLLRVRPRAALPDGGRAVFLSSSSTTGRRTRPRGGARSGPRLREPARGPDRAPPATATRSGVRRRLPVRPAQLPEVGVSSCPTARSRP